MLKPLARLRFLALLGGLLMASACTASNGAADNGPPAFVEGQDYVTLPAPYQRYSSEGKVEVVEVFSYGCIHCAHFAMAADDMSHALPKGAVFKLLPAPFNDEWVPFARAYYAAKQLGVVEKTHLDLFRAKFDQHYPMNSIEELADFYAKYGVNRDEFLRIANSDAVTAQIKKDYELLQKWQVDGTPTIVVDGKYRSKSPKTLGQLAELAKWLAKRELAGK